MATTTPAERLTAGLHDALVAVDPALADGRVEDLKRLSGGTSQETWAFDLVHGGRREPLILRRAPTASAPGAAPSARLVVEAELITLAAQHAVPVPAVRCVLTPRDGLGEGYVMQRLEGETLGRRIATDKRYAAARETLAFDCGRTLARIHAMPVSRSLALAGPATELARYHEWHAVHSTHRPVLQFALRWLAGHAPVETRPRLVHGDFRNGNLMVDADGLRGVLDWELAHAGDPMEDLGWICVNSWRFGVSELPVGGFGTLEQLFAGYRAGGGEVDTERVRWWHVMGTLKWGLVCEAAVHSWLTGTDTSVEKAAIGRRASEAEIDLLDLLVPRS
jgi:aminoglycoside phosphotransferase (APT) family kinase protein